MLWTMSQIESLMAGEFYRGLSARYDELDARYADAATTEDERAALWIRLEALNAVLGDIEAGLICPATGVDLTV